MEYDDFEDRPLFDENVIDFLVSTGLYRVQRRTEYLNKNIHRMMGLDEGVPVFTGDSYEDIAKWLTEIGSDKLDKWLESYYTELISPRDLFRNEGYEKLVSHQAIVGSFCVGHNRRTYLGMHFIHALRGYGLRKQWVMYSALKHIAISKCGKSLEDLYATLEDVDIIGVLAYDDNYPLEKRIRAFPVAAKALFNDSLPNRVRSSIYGIGLSNVASNDMREIVRGISSVIVTCLALVRAESVLTNTRDFSDWCTNLSREVSFYYGLDSSMQAVMFILREVVRVTGTDKQLLDYFKDSIVEALRILEREYGLDLKKIMFSDEMRWEYSTYYLSGSLGY